MILKRYKKNFHEHGIQFTLRVQLAKQVPLPDDSGVISLIEVRVVFFVVFTLLWHCTWTGVFAFDFRQEVIF